MGVCFEGGWVGLGVSEWLPRDVSMLEHREDLKKMKDSVESSLPSSFLLRITMNLPILFIRKLKIVFVLGELNVKR